MLFLNFLLLASEATLEICQSSLVVRIPIFEFMNAQPKVRGKGVDRGMMLHHFSMVNSALIGVFGLHKDGKSSEERPRIEVKLLGGVLEFEMKDNKDGIFNEVLFGPLNSFVRRLRYLTSRHHNLKGFWRHKFHVL